MILLLKIRETYTGNCTIRFSTSCNILPISCLKKTIQNSIKIIYFEKSDFFPRVTMHPTGARQAAIPAAAAGGSKNMFLGGERRRSRRQLLLLLHYNPISSAQKVQLKLY